MADKNLILKCEDAAKRIRRFIIEMTYGTGRGGAHLGGSLSMADLLAGLYVGVARLDAKNPDWDMRDRVILSKGHAAMALYPALAVAGVIDATELSTYKKDGSRLGGHPSLNGLPGIEYASGSLGQGLSLGVGTALALKRKGIPSNVFVLLGDGECNEGSIWEAACSASHFKLDELVAVIDCNGLQYDGLTEEVFNMSPIKEKWDSFGWETLCIDGHNMEEILDAYEKKSDRPKAIIANTLKGKGISFMENRREYHNAALSDELYKKAILELGVSEC